MASEVFVSDSKGLTADLSQDGEVVTLASGDISVVVRGKDSRIELDGREKISVPIGDDRMFIIDLGRSTGFHAITINGLRTYRFATVDAKAKLNGIRDMLRVLENDGLSWGNQLFFSDGEGVPDNRMFVRWLQTEGATVAGVLEEIALRPTCRSRETMGPSSFARPPFDVAGSLALYRRSPETLEERANGAIEVAGRRFTPRTVISRQHMQATDTPPNRRAAVLGRLALRLTTSLRDLVPNDMAQQIGELRLRFERVMMMPLFQTLGVGPRPISDVPHPEELSDYRYSAVLRHYRQLNNMPGWNPALQGSAETFVRHSDEIYQAFVACVIAEAFGMKRVVDELRPHGKRPSFESDEYSMWYDTQPPFMDSWRQGTSLPDDPRPDLVIVDKRDSRFALVDAKYRVKNGGPTNDSLAEVQYYLNTYGLNMAAIAFPGTRAVLTAEAQGNRLLALPIGPEAAIVERVRKEHLKPLQNLMQPAPW